MGVCNATSSWVFAWLWLNPVAKCFSDESCHTAEHCTATSGLALSPWRENRHESNRQHRISWDHCQVLQLMSAVQHRKTQLQSCLTCLCVTSQQSVSWWDNEVAAQVGQNNLQSLLFFNVGESANARRLRQLPWARGSGTSCQHDPPCPFWIWMGHLKAKCQRAVLGAVKRSFKSASASVNDHFLHFQGAQGCHTPLNWQTATQMMSSLSSG